MKGAELIKELSNGYFISIGKDNILMIYDNKFKKICEIKDLSYFLNNIFEINYKEKGENNIELLVLCKNELISIMFDIEHIKYNIKKNKLVDISANICFEMKKNSYIVSGENGVFHLTNFLYNTNKLTINKLLNQPFNSGIHINKNIIVLTSNSVLANGEDKLIFYNNNTKKISKTIQNYSFTISQNGLCLMELNEKNKILLCACKKYSSQQKNGILLVNPQLEDNKEVIDPFYDTDDFEVFCFCQLFINKNNISYNDFLLVGGFDCAKGVGVLKLYKLIKNERAYNTKIEFILDITFEDNEHFDGFELPINSIIQSKASENIIISSWDGKIYLLTPANLDFFFNSDA